MSASSGTGREPDSYDDVRRKLVTLGYLDRPLDRFVLGGLVRPGSFLLRHAVVSAKVALAAAPLLGILFALAVAWVYRPRFSSPGELFWLALDFTLVFGAGIFLLEWLAGLTIAAWVRWRGRGVAAYHATAARAGFAVSLIVSAYLAFWWRRRAGGAGGLLLDALGLMMLLVVNGALFRVSSLASLAALVRVSDLPPNPERRGPSRPLVVALVTATVLVLVFLLAPKNRRADEVPAFTRLPVEGRMLVIAWDGIPIDLYRKGAGGMRLGARELEEDAEPSEGIPGAGGSTRRRDRVLSREQTERWHAGASVEDRRGGDPPSRRPAPGALERGLLVPMNPAPEGRTLSRPALWTEIATGRRAADHGVVEISDRRLVGLSSPLGSDVPLRVVLEALLPGRRVAVSAGLRRALTLWEILAEREGVGAVGWWATWPAIERPTPGRPFSVVSDRAILGLEAPSPQDHRVVPESLARALNVHFQEDLAAVRASYARVMKSQVGSRKDAEGADHAGVVSTAKDPGVVGGRKEPPFAEERDDQAVLIDGWTAKVADRLLADPRIADLFVYFPGLDIVTARLEGSPGSPASFDQIEAHTRYVLESIDRLAGSLRREDWLVVLGDPGREGDRDVQEKSVSIGYLDRVGPLHDKIRQSFRSNGGAWVLISGPGLDGDRASLEPWSPLDVAPTLLNLRGFPASLEMPGAARVDFLSPSWQERMRPRRIPTYGDYAVPALPTKASSQEEEILQRLRSLGYLN